MYEVKFYKNVYNNSIDVSLFRSLTIALFVELWRFSFKNIVYEKSISIEQNRFLKGQKL